jgi:hypothetical protein
MMPFILPLLALPAWAMAFSAGPLNGYTGAPGEENCTYCHWTNPVNSGDGLLSLSGPPTFRAGQTYTLTVQLQDPGQQRWGFEATSLGMGSCAMTDAVQTQIESEAGVQYVKHTSAGTHFGTPDGPVSWSFDWTAPALPPLSVTFYVAGNAANGSETEEGDYVYTTSLEIPLALAPVVDLEILMAGPVAHLNWSPVPAATSYRVERRDSPVGVFQPVAAVPGTTYQDLSAGAFGLYRVVALR